MTVLDARARRARRAAVGRKRHWRCGVSSNGPQSSGIRLLQSLSQAELAGLEGTAAGGALPRGSVSSIAQVMTATCSSWSRAAFGPSCSATGREVVYAVIGAGGHFGELSAIDGLARSASVVAIEVARAAAPTQFEALIRGQPEIAIGLLRGLVRIIRTTDERLIELTTMGAMARVQELLRLAQRDERTGAWMIASCLLRRISPAGPEPTETVARTLSQLARDGIVRRAGRTLHIHNPAQLEAAITRLGSPAASTVRTEPWRGAVGGVTIEYPIEAATGSCPLMSGARSGHALETCTAGKPPRPAYRARLEPTVQTCVGPGGQTDCHWI